MRAHEIDQESGPTRRRPVCPQAFILILDAAAEDTPATLGFESDDCDRDYRTVIARGAVSLQAPANQPWGVRAAYLRGPGSLKFEIEGPLT